MRIIVTTPNYNFGLSLKKSAPAGISVMVGRQAAYSPDAADIPAMSLVGFNKAKPADVTKEQFVTWLLNETTKDERCIVSYDRERIEKQASTFDQLFDEMVRRKDEKPDPEAEL